MGHMCDDYPGKFSSISIMHPSCQLEGMFKGGDVLKLTEKVDCPVFFMPANGDDPKLYDAKDGAVMKVLLSNEKIGKKCKSEYFMKVKHGFTTRGDGSKPEVAEAVQKAIKNTIGFFNENW